MCPRLGSAWCVHVMFRFSWFALLFLCGGFLHFYEQSLFTLYYPFKRDPSPLFLSSCSLSIAVVLFNTTLCCIVYVIPSCFSFINVLITGNKGD